jgi:hypothetical protein
MRLDLTDAEQELACQWRALTADLTPASKAAWTRQGWIPRDVVQALPHLAAAHQATGAAWSAEPSAAISIMESARLHEGLPELLAGSMLRRFLEAPPGSAPVTSPAGSRDSTPPATLVLPGWASGSARSSSLTCRRSGDGLEISGVGSVLAADGPADRAWVVAAFAGEEPGGGCVAEIMLPPRQAAQPAGDGYPVLRDHPPYRITDLQVPAAAVARLLTPPQFTAFRDLVRLGAACALVGLIDTFFDAIVAAAQRKAAASSDRWAAQADKHRGVGIAIHRDVAWLHLFKALDAFADAGDRALFGALALAEAAHGLDDAIADGRRIASLEGEGDVLAAVTLASGQLGFWLDLAGGSGGLTQTIGESRLGKRADRLPSPP